jgi:cytochrome b
MAAAPNPGVAVWPLGVRLLHGVLVGAVAGSTLCLWWFVDLHRPLGYLALAAAALRALWGLLCPRRTHAGRFVRFSAFLRSPRETLAYLRLLRQGREPRHLGHNPLGGWMVLALLACVAGLALSGWLYTSDLFWGDERIEAVHLILAWTLAALVALHVAGVLFTGHRHRENLVRAMLDGRKRAPQPGDAA